MKTEITLIVDHSYEVKNLAEKIAGRAWNIQGVEHVEVKKPAPPLLDLPVIEMPEEVAR